MGKRYGEEEKGASWSSILIVGGSLVLFGLLFGLCGLLGLAALFAGRLPSQSVKATLLSESAVELPLTGKEYRVTFRLTNTHKTKRVKWEQRTKLATLTDEHGNTYQCTGCSPDTPIDPDQSADLSLSFEPPVPNALRLTLYIDGAMIKGAGGGVSLSIRR